MTHIPIQLSYIVQAKSDAKLDKMEKKNQELVSELAKSDTRILQAEKKIGELNSKLVKLTFNADC